MNTAADASISRFCSILTNESEMPIFVMTLNIKYQYTLSLGLAEVQFKHDELLIGFLGPGNRFILHNNNI